MARGESSFDKNLRERMDVTWDSELEPEMVTPNTAGPEELTEYEEVFPLTKQFKQTNMHSRGRRPNSQSQRGRDQD